MKSAFVCLKAVIILGLLVMASLCHAKSSIVNFHVMDEAGQPVSNAVVVVTTFDKHIPGDGFGTSKNKEIKAITDDLGKAVVKFTCKSMQFSYQVTDPQSRFYGEYNKDLRFAYKANSRSPLGEQTEFNKDIRVCLKSIQNPIPLCVARFWGLKRPMPAECKEVGFNFFKGDWVAPYGSGKENHIIFNRIVQADTLSEKLTKFVISFPNKGDGIYISQRTNSKQRGSELPFPYVVPDIEFMPSFSLIFQYKDNKSTSNEDENRLYYIRFNSVLDEEGNLVAAQYGAICGEFVFVMGKYEAPIFLYYVNPNINDRNLEFDTQHNLLEGKFSKWLLRP